MRKFRTLKAGLPEPRLCLAGDGEQGQSRLGDGGEIELLVIGWGSTGDAMQDVMCSQELRDRKIAYLHYTYLWPLCTEKLQNLAGRSKRIVLAEQNYQGQLGMLIKMECGLDIPDKILKYDGRSFFYDEVLSFRKYSEVALIGVREAGVAARGGHAGSIVIRSGRALRVAASPRSGGLRGWRSRAGTVPVPAWRAVSRRCDRIHQGRRSGR